MGSLGTKGCMIKNLRIEVISMQKLIKGTLNSIFIKTILYRGLVYTLTILPKLSYKGRIDYSIFGIFTKNRYFFKLWLSVYMSV